MPVCEIQTNNDNALDKVTSAMVILPDSRHAGPFPVLYLLHGLSGNHASWVRNSNVERYVADLPLIVVMPDGGRSFYTDAAENPRGAVETYIVRDLLGFVDRVFRSIPGREGRVIGGFSMGGYGALKLAQRHCQVGGRSLTSNAIRTIQAKICTARRLLTQPAPLQ